MKIVGLRTLHTDVTVHLQGLNDLGEDINQFAGTLGPALWKKLPEQLRRQWVATEAKKITDLNGIMDMLKKAVESKERFAVLSGNEPKSKKPSPEKKLPNPVATAATPHDTPSRSSSWVRSSQAGCRIHFSHSTSNSLSWILQHCCLLCAA
jgi:hypothetical protein